MTTSKLENDEGESIWVSMEGKTQTTRILFQSSQKFVQCQNSNTYFTEDEDKIIKFKFNNIIE